jgi:hypothetical protein
MSAKGERKTIHQSPGESQMRIIGLVVALFVTFSMSAAAQTYVQGYTRHDGTYVQGHWRSSPDHNPYNNYGYPGNTNPYTGQTATGNPDSYLQRYYSRSTTSGYSLPSYSYPRYASPYTAGSSSDDQ